MSNLSELLPAGGGGKNVNFVASGTLGNGTTVILNSDGTVTQVASEGATQTIGTPTAAATGTDIGDWTDACYDANSNKVIVVYYQGGGACSVGTVSGNTISFGTKVIFNSSSASYIGVACDDSTGKICVVFKSDNNRPYGIIGVVSGTSVSFGTRAVADTGSEIFYNSVVFDSNQNRFVHVFKGNDQGGPVATIGTVSGTNTLSYDGKTTIDSDASRFDAVVFDPNSNKVVVLYRDSGVAKMVVRVGTVTGADAISFGSEVQIDSNNWNQATASFDSSVNKIVFVGRDQTTSNYGVSICGTVSGTSISVGSKYTFRSAAITYPSITYDVTANRHVVSYVNASGAGEVTIGTLTGTALSWTTSTINFTGGTGAVNYISAVYDPDTSRHVTWYRDGAAGGVGAGVTFQTGWLNTNLTSTNFLGITDAAISSGASGSVTIKGGLKSELSSLTPNSIYYVQANGSVSTVTTAPAVRIGKALSSTTLNLEFSS